MVLLFLFLHLICGGISSSFRFRFPLGERIVTVAKIYLNGIFSLNEVRHEVYLLIKSQQAFFGNLNVSLQLARMWTRNDFQELNPNSSLNLFYVVVPSRINKLTNFLDICK